MPQETHRRCFVISPIGPLGSPIRLHADEVFDYIVSPALIERNIEPIRSDKLKTPGRISEQMCRLIFECDLCIAVLTDENPNVYYELAVAQAASKPVVVLIMKDQTLPFDVFDLRAIKYDLTISAYKQRIYIDELAKSIDAIASNDWVGDDAFRAYRKKSPAPSEVDAMSLGITIEIPEAGSKVDIVDVKGTFGRRPERGKLWSLRYYPTQNGFVPHGTIVFDNAAKTWKINGFDVGGEPGNPRGIMIALAGDDAIGLMEYWNNAHSVHREAQEVLQARTGKFGRWLPCITHWPHDLIVCARVDVIRSG